MLEHIQEVTCCIFMHMLFSFPHDLACMLSFAYILFQSFNFWCFVVKNHDLGKIHLPHVANQRTALHKIVFSQKFSPTNREFPQKTSRIIYIYNLKIVVNNNASPDTQCIIYLYRIPTYTFPIRVNHSCRYHTLNVWVNKNTNTFLQSKTQTSQLIQGTVISWWFFTDQTMGFSTVWGFFFSNHQRSKSKLIMRQLGQMSWKKIVGGLQLYKLGQCNYILLLVDNQIIRPTE